MDRRELDNAAPYAWQVVAALDQPLFARLGPERALLASMHSAPFHDRSRFVDRELMDPGRVMDGGLNHAAPSGGGLDEVTICRHEFGGTSIILKSQDLFPEPK